MKIVFATDGTPFSTQAIEKARRLIALEGAEVYVVAVADIAPVMVGYEGPGAGAGVLMDRIHGEMSVHLAETIARFQEAGITATPIDREGDPAHVIVKAAEEVGADLVVVGSHGRSALGRLVQGSVSEAVLHHWHGPVMIVRPDA